MGLCASKDAVGGGDKAVEISPEEKAKMQQAAGQRRRLSVAPEHVGDTSGPAADANQALVSSPSEHEVKSSNAENNNDNNDNNNNADKASFDVRVASHSKKGFVPYNRNKVNQDRPVVKFGLQDNPSLSLFGVMDGHGEFGHFVAGFVKDRLPIFLSKQENLSSSPEQAILEGVKGLVAELANSNIQCAFSGTTCVFAVKVDNRMYVANIGDSRCVVARKDGSRVKAIGLTEDQKPDNPEEKRRILAAGGRVETLPGPPGEDCGPYRVWLAEVDVPGLAMSRSIGDDVSRTVGVISVPEITIHDITDEDVFAIWASDGVWEFIENQTAVDIVFDAMKGESSDEALARCCNKLVADACSQWTKEEEVVDDITCVIVEFHPTN